MTKFAFLLLVIYALVVLGGDDQKSPDPYASPTWGYIGEANSSNSSIPSLRIPMSHIYHRDSKYRPLNCSDECAGRLLLEQAEAWEASQGNFSQQKIIETVQARVGVNYLNGKHYWAHFVTLTLDQGVKAQEVDLILDSGSSITWFQCRPCQSCYPQKRRVVNPNKSPSSRFLSRGDVFCQTVQRSHLGRGADGFNCHFAEQYGDLSFTSGNIVMAAFKFDTWDGQRAVMLENMSFGCRYRNGITHNTGVSGIFGLGTHYGLDWPSQLTQLMGASFGYCLPVIGSVAGQGWLALGSEKKPDPRTAPRFQSTGFILNGQRGFFYLDVIDFVVNNRRLNVPPALFAISADSQRTGGFISDSGFMVTHVTTRVYIYLRAAYRQEARRIFPGNILSGLFGMDTCWDATGIDTSTIPVPRYGLLFGNGKYFEFSRTASFFTYQSRAGHPVICLPISGRNPTPLNAHWLGSYSMMNTAMWHDMENRRLVWAPNLC